MKKLKFLCTVLAVNAVLFSCESDSLADENLVAIEPTTEVLEQLIARGNTVHVSPRNIPRGSCRNRSRAAHYYLVTNRQSIWQGYGHGICHDASNDDYYVVDRNGKRRR